MLKVAALAMIGVVPIDVGLWVAALAMASEVKVSKKVIAPEAWVVVARVAVIFPVP